jgi:hypothetical protein
MIFERRKFIQASAVVAFVAAGGWLAFPKTASAAADPSADIMELQGTQTPGAGSIDPRVGNVAQLKKPPLSSYNTYKLLDKKTLSVKKGTPVSYALANGRVLQLTLTETTADNRYRVLTTITEANNSSYLKKLEVVAGPNELFFVAGQNLDQKNPDKGALVLGITIRP